ncbi:glutamyl-tRNA(Gln) amidotransferase subunit A, mitochondrial [Neodiprion lecontei]|uniref:Glutamyl-tRNA(Gln) amidotransferase subunit A, mitochondrial n=1 Tax=Neodiprion lecontei TaxID=441921 RepID=A0A6J0C589_NEOLC|nr:glutamyl-tRNA(Gln) amidotransferase subunit A, mitochondrial [Neodiprion lecontei]
MNKILSRPIKQVSNKLNAGELKPSEICRAAVKLANASKPLNAYICVTGGSAELQAQESDARYAESQPLGTLDGIPIAIKDNFCTSGTATTCASLMLANFVPEYDATVYSRLKNVGAVLIGKTNLDQFAMGSGTIDSYFGPTKNLWKSTFMNNYFCHPSSESETSNKETSDVPDNWHIAGGSSGGSAIAVATGSCYAALGSDTGGSTRNPASYCGLVGLKPTYGLVSRHGLIPLVNSMDVPGIITRKIDDAVLVLNAIAGPDDFDSTMLKKEFTPIELPECPSVDGLRIGIPKQYKPPGLNVEVEKCLLDVSKHLEEGGAKIVPVSMPHTEHSIVCYSVLNQCEVASNMARYDGIEFGLRVDQNESTEQLYAETRCKGFNEVVRSRILTGNYFLLAENYENYFVRAMKVRRLIYEDFEKVWNSDIDLLLTPTTLTDAPRYREFISMDNQTQCSIQDVCTQPANMAGVPAVSFPVRLSSNGLPLSLQLMAPVLHEQQMLTTAKWIEQVLQFPEIVLKDSSLLM